MEGARSSVTFKKIISASVAAVRVDQGLRWGHASAGHSPAFHTALEKEVSL